MVMEQRKGFTVLEIVIVAIFSSLLLVLFFLQKANVDAMNRDEKRKEAINAMYYALEEGFYAQNKFYPEKIYDENLKVMDPELFNDPMGVNIGNTGSEYVYEPANCENGTCKEYILRAKLEKENDYIKRNRD